MSEFEGVGRKQAQDEITPTAWQEDSFDCPACTERHTDFVLFGDTKYCIDCGSFKAEQARDLQREKLYED